MKRVPSGEVAGGRCLASLSPDLNEGFLETLSVIPLRILQRQRWSNHLPLSTPTANNIPAATTRAANLLAVTLHFQDKNFILLAAVIR
jgi:hypothetical protein